MKRRFLLLGTVLSLFLAVTAQGSQYNAPEARRFGIIHEIDIANYEIIIEGYRYQMSQTAEVEIAGTYGAFTMLSPGMRVEFNYLRFDDGRREIFRVRELMDGEILERA